MSSHRKRALESHRESTNARRRRSPAGPRRRPWVRRARRAPASRRSRTSPSRCRRRRASRASARTARASRRSSRCSSARRSPTRAAPRSTATRTAASPTWRSTRSTTSSSTSRLALIEYIQWRFSGGLDKEQQAMEAAQMSEEEKAQRQAALHRLPQGARRRARRGRHTRRASARSSSRRWSRSRRARSRRRSTRSTALPELRAHDQAAHRPPHAPHDYEYTGQVGRQGDGLHGPEEQPLRAQGRARDARLPQAHEGDRRQDRRRGRQQSPLTTTAIQRHLDDFGLHEEFGTYGKMKNLSGGQKVKIAAAAVFYHVVLPDKTSRDRVQGRRTTRV